MKVIILSDYLTKMVVLPVKVWVLGLLGMEPLSNSALIAPNGADIVHFIFHPGTEQYPM